MGIGTLSFFRPRAMSIGLLVVGRAIATLVTRLARDYLPFPTDTAPSVVVTRALDFLGFVLPPLLFVTSEQNGQTERERR